MTAAAVSDAALARSSAQATLFAERPSRADLLALTLPAVEAQPLRVNVWRNHAFETVARLAEPYLAWGGLAVDWHYSDYDDTLGFATFDAAQPAAAELVWLDPSKPVDVDWLARRIAALRQLSRAPILVVGAKAGLPDLPDVQAADVAALCEAQGLTLLDLRLAKVAGTPLSAPAQALVAKTLAGRWLPALLLPPVKAVAVDLDHTLYNGVLGEDGITGVQLTPAHADFQRSLLALKERGVFLALVSRNEMDDVRALFAARDDFPLRWADFSVTEVSWGDKAEALVRVARQLNIDPSAVAFVDDNPGELAQVASRLPGVRTVFAHADAAITQRALAHLPGLWRWRVGADDAKRVADQAANAERLRLADDLDPEAYLASLGVRLRFARNPADQLDRMAEMSGKTNQFNLALARLTRTDYAERLAGDATAVVTVELADRLADSGVIALLAARRDGPRLVVDELLVSCRAMGRRLEDSIVIGALQTLPALADVDELVFHVADGPRNQPARRWLATWAGLGDEPAPAGALHLPAAPARAFVAPAALNLERIS